MFISDQDSLIPEFIGDKQEKIQSMNLRKTMPMLSFKPQEHQSLIDIFLLKSIPHDMNTECGALEWII